MFFNKLKNNLLLLRQFTLVFVCLALIILSTACSTTIHMSYAPAYIEKTAAVKSKIKYVQSRSVLLMPFIDNRKIDDPSLIYERISLDNQSLSDYLYNALYKDLKMIGFNVVQKNDGALSYKGGESEENSPEDKVNLILSVEINKCIPSHITNFTSVQTYSSFDFRIVIWDNDLSKEIFNSQVSKKITSIETKSSTYLHMVDKLLNEDLSNINADIAEILVTNLANN